MMAMAYGNVYVARIAFGANRLQTIRAFTEADEYDGPSLIIAYSHCINHGYDLRKGIGQQKLAVDSGAWPLFRYNPKLKAEGKNPFILDSKEPTADIGDYMYNEIRFRALKQIGPERAASLLEVARKDAKEQLLLLQVPRGSAVGGPSGRTNADVGVPGRSAVPDWFDDAKLGVMVSWGPYAVPAWAPSSGDHAKLVAENGWEHCLANDPRAGVVREQHAHPRQPDVGASPLSVGQARPVRILWTALPPGIESVGAGSSGRRACCLRGAVCHRFRQAP